MKAAEERTERIRMESKTVKRKRNIVISVVSMCCCVALLVGVLLGVYILLPGMFFLPAVGTLLASFMIERVFKKYMPAKEETAEGEEETGQEKDEWYLE